jgi:hypothetical protein
MAGGPKGSRLGAPMISTIQVLILLLAVVAAVAVIANRSGIPPAILLVLTGVLLALVPGVPPVELTPELVLLLVLPPIIYTSAFLMSWRRTCDCHPPAGDIDAFRDKPQAERRHCHVAGGLAVP